MPNICEIKPTTTTTTFLLAASSKEDSKDSPFPATCARLTVPYKLATQYQTDTKFANFCPCQDWTCARSLVIKSWRANHWAMPTPTTRFLLQKWISSKEGKFPRKVSFCYLVFLLFWTLFCLMHKNANILWKRTKEVLGIKPFSFTL